MSNQVEITLSFKAILDGLQRFGTALEQRMQRVRDFNQSLAQGAAATNALLTQAAAVLGVAAISRYIAKAAEEERAQKQLAAALAQSGQYSQAWLRELEAQAEALQRVTMFSDEDIMAAQRVLASYGVRGQKLKELTKAVLDFAAAQGMDARSAADLVAKTIGSPVNALTRYGVTLDKTKDKTTALTEAIEKLFSGQAEAAVVFPQLHAAGVQLEDIEKALGRIANNAIGRTLISFLNGLARGIELLRALVSWLRSVVPESLRFNLAVDDLARKFGIATAGLLALLAPLLVFKTLMVTLPMVINPARAAFVLFFGEDLLVMLRNLQAFSRALGILETLSLANFAQRLGVVGLVIGSAFAGWQIGTFLNKLEVGGMTVSDWAARIINIFIGWADMVGAAFSKAWVWIKFNFLEKLTEGRMLILEFVAFVAEKLNSIFPKGWKPIPTEGIKAAIAEYKKELRSLEGEKSAAMAAIEKRLAENLVLRGEVDADLAAKGRAGVAAGKPAAQPEPKNNPAGFVDPMAAQKAELQEMFILQTQLLQAQTVGNQAEIDRLQRLIDEKKFAKELYDLGVQAAGPLVKTRLDAEDALRNKERARTADEIQFSQKLGNLEIQRADIEANRLLSTQEKQRQVNTLLAEENRLIDDRLAKDEALLKAGVTDQEKTRLMQEIATLRKQLADNARTREGTRPLTLDEGITAGKQSFISSLGDAAQNAADAVQGSLNSALQSTSDLLYNLASGSMTFSQAWGADILQVGQNFLRMATDMVAKIIWRATVERAVTAMSVALHIGAEGAKTAATASGSAIRIGHIIKEALAAVYHGAVEAFSAMASIPYIGPFLAFAAMAAALAGGIALISKIGHASGGLLRGPGGPTDDRILTRLSNGEFVARASAVDKFGAGFFESLNAGVLDLAALPGSVARQIPASAAAGATGGGPMAGGAGSPNVRVAFAAFNNQQHAAAWLETQEGERYMVNFLKRRGFKNG